MRFPIDNSNRGRITYRLRDIIAYEVENRHFAHCILIVGTQRRKAQQHHCIIYIAEKNI